MNVLALSVRDVGNWLLANAQGLTSQTEPSQIADSSVLSAVRTHD